MTKSIRQHLIDPEICIRCYTCEMTCPIQAIHHNDDNVVVDAEACNFCMDCIPVCPTGSIDEWRVVHEPYSMEEQFEWMELPEQEDIQESADNPSDEAIDDAVAALLAEAHKGSGGRPVAPKSAAK
ncbi:MAG: 4Fe-4S binding protein, partial [Paracoccaceae bacterium]